MEKKAIAKIISIVLFCVSASVFVIFFRAHADTDDATIYVVPALNNYAASTGFYEKICDDSYIHTSFISKNLSIQASPGEYEPGSFVVKANNALNAVTVEISNLTSGGNTISSSAVDVKILKCWYQAEYGTTTGKRLSPELLLNNDALVNVVGTDNYLWLNGEYVLISDQAGVPGYPAGSQFSPTITEFPVQDAATLQPVSIAQGKNKQFWVTVLPPSDAVAGNYTGTITLKTGSTTISTIQLNLRVLPIILAAPANERGRMEYGLYYKGQHTPTSTIASNWKSEAQMVADMQDMVRHGINPAMYGYEDGTPNTTTTLDSILDLREEAGVPASWPLYYLSVDTVIGWSIDPAWPAANVTADKAVVDAHGVSDFYTYAPDEGNLNTELFRTQMAGVHAVGGKVFDAQSKAQADSVADILDVAVVATASTSTAALYHSYGHKVFLYAAPFMGAEYDNWYRASYGLGLWQYDYDGMQNYAYQAPNGNIWDDFDNQPNGPDFVFAYPTVNGVIDTIQGEAMREGIDDIRYLTTLQNLITANQSSGAHPTASAENYLTKLKAKSIGSSNFNTIRQQIIDYILYFLDQGPAPAYDNICGNSAIEPGEECEGANLNGATCSTFGYTGGTLSCRSDCYLDKSSCTPAVPLTASFSTSTDFSGGYSNRTYLRAGINVQSTYDSSAYVDFTGADKTLLAHWNFNEGAGTSTADVSGLGNTASLSSGDYSTADSGTTSSTVKETSAYMLSYYSDYYNGWTFEALSGAAAGQTSLISDYVVNNLADDRDIHLATPLEGFAAGDTYHIYKDTGGPTWTTGKYGNGIQFDGIDDYLWLTGSYGAGMDGNTRASVAAWIKPTTASATIFRIGPIIIILSSQRIYAAVGLYGGVGAGGGSLYGATTIPLNQWTHVAVVYDDGYLKIYVNGSLDDSYRLLVSGGNLNASACDQIGRSNNGNCSGNGADHFKGVLDEMYIFKRALSDSEIKALYNAGAFPIYFNSAALSAGIHSFQAHAFDTNGGSALSATGTVRTATYSSASDLNLSDLGVTTGTLKFLAGTSWDQFATSSASVFDVTATSTNSLKLGTTSSLLELTPSGGDIQLHFDAENNLSGGFVSSWTASSTASATALTTTVKTPKVNTYYNIKVNGSQYHSYQSDSGGNVAFTYNGGFSAKEFTIEEDTTPPSAFDLLSPANGINAQTSLPSFAWSSPGDPDLDHFSFYIDGVSKKDDIASTTLLYALQDQLSSGAHNWYVKAYDNAENARDSATWSVNTPTIGISHETGTGPFEPVASPATTTASGAASTSTAVQPAKEVLPVVEKGTPAGQQEAVKKEIAGLSLTKNLKSGSRGEDVKALQKKLKELGYINPDVASSGYYGVITEKGVRAFQASVGINPTGTVGPRTRRALAEQEFITNKDYIFTADLNYGSTGTEVKELQTRLRDQNFYPDNVTSTGWFGPITEKAVNLFRNFFKLIASGVVDVMMRGILNR